MELNIDFLNRMKTMLGVEYDEFLHALKLEHKKGLVVNNLKVDEKIVKNSLSGKIDKLPYGRGCYILNIDEKLGSTILHKAGAFYLQEPSAIVPGIVLPLKKGDVVLDVCASPGGKTFNIARREDVTILSNEIDYSRAKTLLSNVERLGLTNVMVSNFSSQELSSLFPYQFDAVIIDAPCSGEGMFRKEDYAIEQWSLDYVNKCVKMQKEIMQNIDTTLKCGGYLVYSTCTYSLEENEKNIALLVDMGYEIVDIEQIAGASNGVKLDDYNTNLCKRFYPHKSFGEGQFVALLKKVKQDEIVHKKKYNIAPIGNFNKKLVLAGLKSVVDKELLEKLENSMYEKNDGVFYCPNAELLVKDKKILSYGVKLGNIIGNRFEPCHNMFTAFSSHFVNQIEVDDESATKYLRGETLNTDSVTGWCVVKFKDVALGGGKVVNGVIKNHYPKGLRNP